jgi:maltooligosyltrehalose synthase
VWDETALLLPPELPAARWTNVFTGATLDAPAGGTLPVARVLDSFPVALLVGHR